MAKVFLAGDHAFFALKGVLAEHAHSLGHEVEDLGAFSFNENDDYPDFIAMCASHVASTSGSFGIIGGGSGQGEEMVANRIAGIRADVCYGKSAQQEDLSLPDDGYNIVRLAREHNNANMLSFGARFMTNAEAKEALRIFLATPFSGDERHRRRLAKF